MDVELVDEFQDQNPESARTVTGPVASVRRRLATSSLTNPMIPREDPAEPFRIRENKISPVPARVATSG